MSKLPSRDEMRAAAPELAAFVDAMREEFGPVKVTYLKIDSLGVEVGEKPPVLDYTPADTKSVREYEAEWEAARKAADDARRRMAGKRGRRK